MRPDFRKLSRPLFALSLAAILLSACLTQTPTPEQPILSPIPPTSTLISPSPAPSPTPTGADQLADSSLSTNQLMFRGGPLHTGVYAVQGDYGEWLFRAAGPIGASPVLSAGTLYFGTMTGSSFYAVDPSTQNVRWGRAVEQGIFSSPAVIDGSVYVGTLSGDLLALDEVSGDQRWVFHADGPMISSPAVANSTIYVGTQTGQIYAIDAKTGKELWKYQTNGAIQASPTIMDGVMVIGSGDGFLYALDAATGQKKWLYLSEGQISSSAAIFDGVVYFGSLTDNNSFYAVDLQTGHARWKVKAGPVISSPAIMDGILYVGVVDGSVLAGKAEDGSLLWATKTGGAIISSPAVAGESVYIGSSDGKLYSLDRLTGNIQWSYQTNGDIWSSPAVAGETIFFGSGDHTLYALRRQSPKLALAPTPTSWSILPTPTIIPEPPSAPRAGTNGLPWWNDRVFYEVFVRSFYDSNADGMGDLKGLIQKLDYLNDGDPSTSGDLGVTGLWLMPVSEAPSIHGYDATDFRKVEQDYGTNDDFKRLIQEAHKRGIVVIVDMVMNHTSSQNPWFQDAMMPGSEHENWYIWSPEDPGYQSPWDSQVWFKVPEGMDLPRSYHSLFDYYYALFSPTQPDLNYRNGAVTQEMYDILRFWLEDMGADGFRLDAVRHLIEDGQLQSGTPETHAWLKGFYRFVHTLNPNALTVGEIWQDTSEVAPYVGDEVNIAFEFDLADAVIKSINQGDNADLVDKLGGVLQSYPQGQFATFLTNHDMARAITQFNGGTNKAKLAGGLLLALPGVPFIYYGEEIGMTGPLPDINVRLPMQWDSSTNAGFTGGTPWQPLNLNYRITNVALEANEPDSIYNLYREMIRLRLDHEALRSGDTYPVKSSAPGVFGFLRQSGSESILVVANLTEKPITGYSLSLDYSPLKGRLKASLLTGEGKPAALTANVHGGFGAYTPLAELPALSITLVQLSP
jgi:alpha-amylase